MTLSTLSDLVPLIPNEHSWNTFGNRLDHWGGLFSATWEMTNETCCSRLVSMIMIHKIFDLI
jgi:hypothetical protein